LAQAVSRTHCEAVCRPVHTLFGPCSAMAQTRPIGWFFLLLVQLLTEPCVGDNVSSTDQEIVFNDSPHDESTTLRGTPRPTPAPPAESRRRGSSSKLRVAVIGGGIAGSSTTLELLNHDNVEITLFEQGPQIGHNKSASGIIAALTATFNPGKHHWGAPDEPLEIQETLQQQARFYKVSEINRRMIEFAHRMALNKVAKHDKRTQKEYKHHFNQASRARLEEQLDKYPQLCEAIQGPYCCRPGSKAKEWIDSGEGGLNGKHNETCNIRRGLFHIWKDIGWHAAKSEEGARQGHWQIADREENRSVYQRAVDFLDTPNIAGALWNSRDEGFVRVETLYPILTKLFEEKGVTLALNCLVKGIRNETGAGIEVVIDNARENCDHAGGVFDRVIVSGGANTVNILEGVDELIYSDLMPVKGFAVATHSRLFEPDQVGMGAQVEDLAHYVRPMIDGGVAYGYGKEIGTFDDELLDPKFNCWKKDEFGPEVTGLGRKVLEQPDVMRLSGIRPLSHFNDFPLLKHYDDKWSGLVLNTGYGFYGYTLSWKSSQIAVDFAVTGKVSDEEFKESIELYSACGSWPCGVWHWYLLFGWFAWSSMVCSCGSCCCCGGIIMLWKYTEHKYPECHKWEERCPAMAQLIKKDTSKDDDKALE